ncbi:MAG: hypothetical protein RBR28_09280 [Lentimicrobium sp.]|jgi:hypothetical protein|nr:hypothetical protein [Lentimicrobium sp.]
MRINEFENLEMNEKVAMLFAQGTELLERIYMYYIVKLYHLDNLFVEIWYHQTLHRIDKVFVVELDDVIHLYEKQINISDLFK